MSITLTQQPPLITFSRNPVVFQFKTDAQLQSEGTYFSGHIVSSAGINAEYDFVLNYAGIDLTFGVRVSPDDSGSQVRARWAGATDLQYAQSLAADLNENFYLNRDYVLTGLMYYGAPAVKVVARKKGGEYNATIAANNIISLTYNFGGTPDVVNPNFKIYYELWLQRGSQAPQKVSDGTYLEPNDAGVATVDISGQLTDAMLADGYDRPDFNNAIALVNNKSVIQYYIRYAEVYGVNQVIRKTKSTDVYYSMLGGISNEMLATFSFPGNLIAGGLLRFLKQEPAEKALLPEQPEYLTTVLFDAGLLGVQLKFTIYYDDDTTTTVFKHGVGDQPRFAKLTFPVGFVQNNLNLVSIEKAVVKYTVQMVWGDNNVISETKTYWINYAYQPYVRTFIYLSSWGTYDTLISYGKASMQYELTLNTAEIGSDKGFVLANGEQINYGTSLNNTESVTSGYLEKSEIRLFKDMALSLDLLLYRKKRIYAVGFSSKTVKEFKDGESLHAINFEIGFRYQEELFTVDEQDDIDVPLFMPMSFTAGAPDAPVPDGALDYRYYRKNETYTQQEVNTEIGKAKKLTNDLRDDLVEEFNTVNENIASKAPAFHDHDDRYLPKADMNELLEQLQHVLDEGVGIKQKDINDTLIVDVNSKLGVNLVKVTAREDFDALRDALIPHPTYNAPVNTLSANKPLTGEIGETISNLTVTQAFAQRDGGQAYGFQVRINGSYLSVGVSYTETIVLSATPVTYQGVVFYYEGPTKKNILNMDDPYGKILAGSALSNTLTAVGQYKHFFAPVAATPATAAAGRLGETALNFALASASSFTLKTGTIYNRFAALVAPGKKKSKVVDTNTNNDITGEYELINPNFSVNNAAGVPVAGWKLYVKIQSGAYDESHDHVFTLVND